ncbi:MAG: sulfotransferase family protein [Pseudomonadota bacterium]
MSLINLWSGPRNVSTALMYSFRQHPDVRVEDEPLYAHYLARSGRQHPDSQAVLASQPHDGNAVIQRLLAQTTLASPHVFAKHMAHHLIDIDLQPMFSAKHVLLIRDPEQMLSSLTIQLPDARLADTGLAQQCELLDTLNQHNIAVAVIDSRELLLDPEDVLRQLCEVLNLPWTDAMLHWPTGPKPEDGVWAPHWYHAVHKSTGFSSYRHKPPPDPSLNALLTECQPYYQRLYQHALRARSTATP